jgi:hypothetical protein
VAPARTERPGFTGGASFEMVRKGGVQMAIVCSISALGAKPTIGETV